MFLSGQDLNLSVGKVYLSEAKNIYNEGKEELALSLLEKARDFIPEVSDVDYLESLIRSVPATQIKLLERAYQNNRWISYSSQEGLKAYLALLYRLMKYRKIHEIYRELPEILKNNPTVIYTESVALWEEGNRQEAVELALKLLNSYPEYTELWEVLLLDNLKKYLPELTVQLKQFPPANARIFRRVMMQVQDKEEKRKLNRLYLRLFGKDIYYEGFLLADREKVSDEEIKAFSEKLKKNKDFTFMLYLTDSLKNPIWKETLKKNLDGEYKRDYNYDGYNNEVILFRSGRPVRRVIDENQDGLDDILIEFNEKGFPRWTWMKTPRGILTFEYKDYPYVQEVSVTNQYYIRKYKIFLSKLSRPLFPAKSAPNKLNPFLSELKPPVVVDESPFLKNGYSLFEYTKDHTETPKRQYVIRNGRIIEFYEDTDRNGFFDRNVVVKNWKVQAARRDINEDGKIDVYEYYDNGEWQGLAFDSNGDYKADYYRDWLTADLKIWDFNEDHFVNASLIGFPEKTKKIRFFEGKEVSIKKLFPWKWKNQEDWFLNQ